MSIYMAYAVDMVLLAPVVVTAMLQGRSIGWIVGVSLALLLPLSPLTLRLTRAAWIHIDHWMDPRI